MFHVSADLALQSTCMSEFDDIVSRVQAALGEARKRVTILEGLIKSLEQARLTLPPDILSSTLESISPTLSGIKKPQIPQEPQRVRGEMRPYEIASLARNALLSVGRPLKRGQLVRELEKRGVPLAGTDKNKNLGTILWRHQELFVSLPQLGYWAKGVPLAGVYDPIDDATDPLA